MWIDDVLCVTDEFMMFCDSYNKNHLFHTFLIFNILSSC